MDDTQIHEISVSICSEILTAVAPEELEDYQEFLNQYLKSSKSTLVVDLPAAYGINELLQIVTPLAFEAAVVLITFLVKEMEKSAESVAANAMKSISVVASKSIRRWLNAKTSASTKLQLTKVQKEEVTAKVNAKLEKN